MQRSVGLSRASPDRRFSRVPRHNETQSQSAYPPRQSTPHAQKFLPATLVKKIVILLHVEGALPLWLDGHGGENHKGMVAIPAVADRAGVQSKPQLARHHTAGAFSASSAIPLTCTSGSRWTSLRKESRLPRLSSVSSTFIK